LARRRFFVDQVQSGRATITGEHAHHLHHVLRTQPGQVFEISDSKRVYLGRVTASGPSAVEFAVEEELPEPVRLPCTTLLAAIFKFDRFEWMLEKATELGADVIVPVVASRTEVKLAAAAPKRTQRWTRLVFEAAQQARRVAPPQIGIVQPFAGAVRGAEAGSRWFLDENAGGQEGRPLLTHAGVSTTLLAGPEGGWTDAERDMALDAGFQRVSLGPLILRAETACLAALAVLLYTNSGGDPTAEK